MRLTSGGKKRALYTRGPGTLTPLDMHLSALKRSWRNQSLVNIYTSMSKGPDLVED